MYLFDADFRLEAITLRGIGSYLHGARLVLKPLTVLCGKNGSGKSTWFRSLNLLQEALDAGTFPYGYPASDWEPYDIRVINAYYHLGWTGLPTQDDDAGIRAEFGPPGTIGLEFVALKDQAWNVPGGRVRECGNQYQELLWNGVCPAGTRFQLRIAHPTYISDDVRTPNLYHLIELVVDDTRRITFTAERDPWQKFEKGYSRPRRSKPYEVSCSSDFLPSIAGEEIRTVVICTITDLANLVTKPSNQELDSNKTGEIVNRCEHLIRTLARGLLAGVFCLGAVRRPQSQVTVGQATGMPDVRKDRYVGVEGEAAWDIERVFGGRLMTPYCLGEFSPQDIDSVSCLWSFQTERHSDPQIATIWECADPTIRQRVEALEVTDGHDQKAAELLADLLNSALHSEELFDVSTWESIDEDDRFDAEDGVHFVDPEVDYFFDRGIESLSRQERSRLNRVLIAEALGSSVVSSGLTRKNKKFRAVSYLSAWSTKLLDVGIAPGDDREQARDRYLLNIGADFFQFDKPPVGYLLDFSTTSIAGCRNLHRLIHGECPFGS